VRGIPSVGKLLECKEEKMNNYEINGLKQFFSRAYIMDHFGKVAIAFQEIGIKFDEKNAVLTDGTIYNHLSVGDWCAVGGRLFGEVNYKPKEGVSWKEANDELRIILAFFEAEGKIIDSEGGGKVRRVFCATGIVFVDQCKYLRDRQGWPPKARTTYFDGIEICLDALHYAKRNHPVKLFSGELLLKRERPEPKKQPKSCPNRRHPACFLF